MEDIDDDFDWGDAFNDKLEATEDKKSPSEDDKSSSEDKQLSSPPSKSIFDIDYDDEKTTENKKRNAIHLEESKNIPQNPHPVAKKAKKAEVRKFPGPAGILPRIQVDREETATRLSKIRDDNDKIPAEILQNGEKTDVFFVAK